MASKELKKFNRFDVVVIKWNDAHNLSVGWTDHRELPSLKTKCIIESVGYFVQIDGPQAVFCADRSVEDPDEVILNTIFTIPVACIVQATKIRSANGRK